MSFKTKEDVLYFHNGLCIGSNIPKPNQLQNCKFGKVSIKEFFKSLKNNDINAQELIQVYEDIKLPRRATKGSAGYDIFIPYTVEIEPYTSVVFPTGINIKLPEDKVLKIYPRSGLGFKYGTRLSNTVGIIDSDYIFSDNEGHIQVKIFNDSDKTIVLEKGSAVAQGVIEQYFITTDDNEYEKKVRNGGLGSSD